MGITIFESPVSQAEINGLTTRVTSLEEKYVKTSWYETINSGTNGILKPPSNGTIVLDQWASGIDAVTSKIEGEIPN